MGSPYVQDSGLEGHLLFAALVGLIVCRLVIEAVYQQSSLILGLMVKETFPCTGLLL